MDAATAVDRQSTAQRSELPIDAIERLFARFTLAYGTDKANSMWRGQDGGAVKVFWARELARFTGEELRAAMDALYVAHPSWPPTLPEFCALCRPAPAAPNYEAAFHEALRGIHERKNGAMGQWSSRAVFWAMVDVSPFDMTNSTWPQIRGRWTQALDRRMADQNLPAITEPPRALPAPDRGDVNAEGLARIQALIANAPRVGPRAWAVKILERKAAGDVTLWPIAVKMALDSDRIAAGGVPRNYA